ncbi:CDK-activating kinase assembly factor MAT1 [Talaromyces stipitatus ATCC 10500]|uniref:RNA polymerase II transcription factor B subunit 3 n=1 Tax=Talaromyces stipitatus (strain ATCC 10500 / CBS 375.48 / QM 6759 / NRRL 1006) TaxID=441959 RepID=B8ME57_TALSN|nr:CDK-activating kinase assembly factor MAT1 [Talaromyces stipitatus ATCC 10500]EED16485.1 CDK-activating kinase assembly factor MAT1 [Talaromyces stipitatus ATCC 10500]
MSGLTDGSARRDEDEVCPICKSSRYLNPDMRFLINPECYHKMCESCVDRIFSSGPNSCPVIGCKKTLRKNRFRTQTFEDIGVEREVDIRKRVMAILNRREDEFDSKLDWDNFLEQRETMIMNLVSGIDVAKTEADLRKYQAQNLDSIRANQARESQETSSFQEQQSFEQEQARLRRIAVREEYEREHRELAAGREDILSRLASGRPGDAASIAREGQKILLKKSSARRSEEERLRQKQAALRGEKTKGSRAVSAAAESDAEPSLIKGLKKVSLPEPEKPYDPFGGLEIDKRDYYVLQDHYPSQWLDQARNSTTFSAGGFDIKEYYSRTLFEAFAGLGVFVEEEVSKRDSFGGVTTKAAVATRGAAQQAATVRASDDVF